MALSDATAAPKNKKPFSTCPLLATRGNTHYWHFSGFRVSPVGYIVMNMSHGLTDAKTVDHHKVGREDTLILKNQLHYKMLYSRQISNFAKRTKTFYFKEQISVLQHFNFTKRYFPPLASLGKMYNRQSSWWRWSVLLTKKLGFMPFSGVRGAFFWSERPCKQCSGISVPLSQ